MKAKDVITKYNAIVPFPWSPSKLKRAGHDPSELLKQITEELINCEDCDHPKIRELAAEMLNLLDTQEEIK